METEVQAVTPSEKPAAAAFQSLLGAEGSGTAITADDDPSPSTNGGPYKKLKTGNGDAVTQVLPSSTNVGNGTAAAANDAPITITTSAPATGAAAICTVESEANNLTDSGPVGTATTPTIANNDTFITNRDEETPLSNGGRPRRRSAARGGASVADAVTAPKSNRKRQKKVETTEEEFQTAWICCECNEAECLMVPDADQLLICEGSCRRLFHYPCAGLARLPAERESYVCQDCRTGRHVCALCQNYGVDEEDVFVCSAPKCGLYYHEACLQLRDVEVTLVPYGGDIAAASTTAAATVINSAHADDNQTGVLEDKKSPATTTDDDEGMKPTEDRSTFRREFKCPAHCCWTCTQKDMVEKEKQQAAAAAAAASTNNKKKRGRKKTKPVHSASFGQKTGQLTIRCLVCPNSYHLTCIPPPARFNELSLLCPDHVADHKLPEVDPETSLQTKIEKKIDAKYAVVDSPSRRRNKRTQRKNPFFHGMAGKTLTTTELELMRGFENDPEHGSMDTFYYCLPCNIRDEVHAKPPSFKLIHTNRVNPKHAPAPIKHSGETCGCVGVCDESCFNRLLYVECVRDKGTKGTNCAVGKGCGNRRLGQRQFKKCRPKREKGKGWGLVVQEDVEKGELIVEYVGEVIDEKAKEARLDAWEKEHPNDPNFYIMGLGKGWYVDARDEANLSRFINHSCDPNGIVHTINVNGYLRNGIFALHDIPAGTFLSYDYHFETTQGDRFVCRCGSRNCRGTMKDRILPVDDTDKKTKKQLWEAAKRDYDRDKAFLEDFYAKERERRSQVDAMVPESDFPSDLVSNGPHPRHRADAVRGRVFLWRNAQLGADFARRFARLEEKKKASS